MLVEQTTTSVSAIIITLNAADRIGRCCAALVQGDDRTLLKEVIVADGGSSDATRAIATSAGARIVDAPRGRGAQLAAGAAAASGDWLLFLHGDTALSEGWAAAVEGHMAARPVGAGVFRLAFDGGGRSMEIVAAAANLRSRAFAAPYGDQGLLVRRDQYDEVGGFRPMPLFEDVNFVDRYIRRFGRRRLRMLPSPAVTSAERYARAGPARRILRNAACLSLYRAGVSPQRIVGLYEGR